MDELVNPVAQHPLLQYVLIFAVSSILAVCWVYRDRAFGASSSANSPKAIPRPPGRPFRGNSHELQTNGAASCVAWYSLYERYGPAYEMTVPYFRMHIINHPIYLEHIQKHNSKAYIRGKFVRHIFGPLHRTGIFVADGDEWHSQRKAATRAFSKRNFETHITKSVHYWLDILMGLLTNLAKAEQEFDLQELMSRLMFCLFLRIAFHEDELAAEVLSEDPKCLESMPSYIEAFDKAALCFDRRRRDPLWRITEWLSGEGEVTRRATDLFYEKIDKIILKRIELVKNGHQPDPDAGVDMLDLFLQSEADPYTLGGMVLSFLLAGRDTTAFSMTWLMKEIHHKDNARFDAPNKIRAEANELGFGQQYLDYAGAPRMLFANAMWDETARLDTVSPAGQMEAAEDDILPAIPEFNLPPRRVKKGDIVSYQNYVLSRMPEVWGKNAHEFDPYRWLNPDGTKVTYSPFKYHSWNAGPRSCIGRALATYEGITIATAILQRFDVILANDTKKYESLPALNMGVMGGLPMTVRARSSKV